MSIFVCIYSQILYSYLFDISVYTNDMSYFIQGLKSIANILLAAESLPSIDENGTVTDPVQTNMTIFSLTDFVIQADELFDTNDLSAQQYATLLNAIFSGHSSVQSLFDLYHNPDFLLAVDADEDLRESLCSRDLLHLGKKLEPLSPIEEEQDDNLLKWAIKTSLHNFATTLSTGLPQEFVNIIYHMFSSGDEMVLGACQKFVDAHVCGAEMESDPVEDMLFREYSIYERNRAFREELSSIVSEEVTSVDEPSESLVESSLRKASPEDEDNNKDFPDCLLTAVACLVDQEELTEDTAAAILASYAGGHSLLHDIYDHFIEFGGVDDFLSMVSKCVSCIFAYLVRLFDYSIAHYFSFHLHISCFIS